MKNAEHMVKRIVFESVMPHVDRTVRWNVCGEEMMIFSSQVNLIEMMGSAVLTQWEFDVASGKKVICCVSLFSLYVFLYPFLFLYFLVLFLQFCLFPVVFLYAFLLLESLHE